MHILDPINQIPLIGERYQAILHKLNIFSVADLLNYFPVKYIDSSEILSINDLSRNEKITIKARVESIKNVRLRGRKSLQKAILSDDIDQIEAVWFNQPFLSKNFKIGSTYLFAGKLNPRSIKPQLSSPDYQLFASQDADKIHLGRITPIYSLTQGVSNKWLRSRLYYLISKIQSIEGLTDSLDTRIIEKYKLLDQITAIQQIHFPDDDQLLEQAKMRLGFEELLGIQLKLLEQKNARLNTLGPQIKYHQQLHDQILKNLPYTLTPSQFKALDDLKSDLKLRYPFKRLIQGDVGSGKTIIALLLAAQIAANHYQVVLLAPTSILANQHYQVFQQMLGKQFKIGLYTSSTKKLWNSKFKIDIIIGTHAILHAKNQLISKLGLLIIDEQHKFGVNQRRELLNLKYTSHLLHMTATPIPRTLAQTLFGDFDVSIIYKPTIRKTVATHVVPEFKLKDSYHWLKQKLSQGGQAFWIFPLIEETEISTNTSLISGQKWISQQFPEFKNAILHGKMSTAEKNQILTDFQNKKITILISTTVVEVGIDIPGANLIIIEAAEMYGLAQLHQLRGRVGRSNQDAWCLLFTNKHKQPKIIERLNFFAHQSDGIKIAEYDLQSRGPGEVYGIIQSGLPALKIANFGNIELIKQTREAAKLIINQ